MGIIIYHGSNAVVEFPEIRIAKYTKDFSWGFYCTKSLAQAQRWAYRNKGSQIVNAYEYTENSNLKIKRFSEMTDEWLDFIASCRKGNTHDYDIVEGPMADDTIWNYVSDFIRGDIPREAFWALAKFKYPTHQISFHTLRALNCLRFVGSEDAHE